MNKVKRSDQHRLASSYKLAPITDFAGRNKRVPELTVLPRTVTVCYPHSALFEGCEYVKWSCILSSLV